MDTDACTCRLLEHLAHGPPALGGGDRVGRLADERRSARPLTEAQVLAWADDHRARTGNWPRIGSGPVLAAPGETWASINQALTQGWRRLPGGDSLPRLLARERGARNLCGLSKLTEAQIVRWAKAHYERTEGWPHTKSGPVEGEHGERWSAIDHALHKGCRGLPGGDTLRQLLGRQVGARARRGRKPTRKAALTVEQILGWADAYRERTGRWPHATSGRVVGGNGETWSSINSALWAGCRGLPDGDTLARLLERHRGHRSCSRAKDARGAR